MILANNKVTTAKDICGLISGRCPESARAYFHGHDDKLSPIQSASVSPSKEAVIFGDDPGTPINTASDIHDLIGKDCAKSALPYYHDRDNNLIPIKSAAVWSSNELAQFGMTAGIATLVLSPLEDDAI